MSINQTGENPDLEFSTFAEYEKVKGSIVNLYFIAARNLSDMIYRPSENNRQATVRTLFQLLLILKPKMYVLAGKTLKEHRMINYCSYFLANPEKFKFVELNAVFASCQHVIERLGITKIESAKVPQWQAFKQQEA